VERRCQRPEMKVKFDEDDNPIVSEDSSKLETSKAPTLEYLMKKLEKLKAENKKFRAKG
jgi:hypothetical protein